MRERASAWRSLEIEGGKPLRARGLRRSAILSCVAAWGCGGRKEFKAPPGIT
jgi:hypothetical protein